MELRGSWGSALRTRLARSLTPDCLILPEQLHVDVDVVGLQRRRHVGLGRLPLQSCAPRSGRELLQERARSPENRRVEPFGEPVVDGREKITGFSALTLIAPEACETSGSAKFKGFRVL